MGMKRKKPLFKKKSDTKAFVIVLITLIAAFLLSYIAVVIPAGQFSYGAQFCADSDSDGSCDSSDNCRSVYNSGQGDADFDGVGDPCDSCQYAKDPGQTDSDNDGLGDACDFCYKATDRDRDGICDERDNCPKAYNPNQKDSDYNGAGDACDK